MDQNNIDALRVCKHLISGMRTVEDCYLMLDKNMFDKNHKSLILHLINHKKNEKCFDYMALRSIVKELGEIRYREDAHEYLSHIMNKTENIAQIKTFTRLAEGKPLRPQWYTKENYSDFPDIDTYDYANHKIEKKCPHCSHINISHKSTGYIICGYGENGYDWEGCGKDWCFKCEKILCKSWDNDMLFIEENRIHNEECCRHHSNINNKKYPEDYCHCIGTARKNISNKYDNYF